MTYWAAMTLGSCSVLLIEAVKFWLNAISQREPNPAGGRLVS